MLWWYILKKWTGGIPLEVITVDAEEHPEIAREINISYKNKRKQIDVLACKLVLYTGSGSSRDNRHRTWKLIEDYDDLRRGK